MTQRKRIQTYLRLAIVCKCLFAIGVSESFEPQSSAISIIDTCSNYFGCGSGYFYTGPKLCCLTCNCNRTCIDTHSCCPESGYMPTNTKPYTSNDERLVCKNTVLIGQARNIYEHPEFEFIESCTDLNDEHTRLYCEDIALTNRSGVVAENTPVLDTTSGLSYKNIHCARCNNVGVSRLEAWRPKLECNDKFDLRTESFGQAYGLERLIEYNRCLVSFEPPASYVNVTQCYVDVISVCNVTGRWLTYNQTDMIRCQTLDLIYVSYNDFGKYKNLFCARCNGENVYVPADNFCPLFSNRFIITLTTILAFTIDELESSSQSDLNHVTQDDCPPTFKLDPLTDNCRPIYCSLPFSVDPFTSTCRLFHQFIENVHFVIPFKVEFRQLTPIRDAQTLAEIIHFRVVGDDFLKNCDVGIYYQTNTVEIGDLNTSLPLDFNVFSIYITVYSYINHGNPKELFELFDARIRTYMFFEGIVIHGAEAFDPVMLTYNESRVLEWIKLAYEERFSSPSHYVFRNYYDDTVIIGPEYTTDFGYCKARIYQADFLPCASFLYHIFDIFHHIPNGLLIDFKGHAIVFNFSEFKTVNETTIRICSDSVTEKITAVNSASYIFALKIFTLIIVVLSNTVGFA